ncbi:MAG: PHP domain-containing protein [Rhodocyclaceae bacterium]|nr:PHP domain-containing protein [Rhodocyclaceae bacterium]
MATFKDIEAIDNGARFVNVDLHIHSYGASADVTDTAMTPKAIVDSALKQGLSVIAITDHNSDANVAEAVSYATTYSGQTLVIPGVEVTTAHGHLLAYFAPDKVDALSTFLAKLDLLELRAQRILTRRSRWQMSSQKPISWAASALRPTLIETKPDSTSSRPDFRTGNGTFFVVRVYSDSSAMLSRRSIGIPKRTLGIPMLRFATRFL